MSTSVLKFKAGKVEYDETTKQAKPLPALGQITVEKYDNDATILNFRWEPREKKPNMEPDEEDSLVLIAGDPVWRHVKQCKTGRVFSLHFRSSGRSSLFWMQSPVPEDEPLDKLTEHDLEIQERLSKLLQEGDEMDVDDSDTGTAEPIQQLAQQHENTGSAGASADATAPSGAAIASAGQSDNTDSPGLSSSLSQLLGSMRAQGSSGSNNPIGELSAAVTPSEMVEYVRGVEGAQLEQLLEFVPAGLPKTKDELIRLIHSPQFMQSMSLLSQALHRGMGSVVARELGYEYEGEGVDGYLKGVRKQSKKD